MGLKGTGGPSTPFPRPLAEKLRSDRITGCMQVAIGNERIATNAAPAANASPSVARSRSKVNSATTAAGDWRFLDAAGPKRGSGG